MSLAFLGIGRGSFLVTAAAVGVLAACTSIVGISDIQYFEPDAGKPSKGGAAARPAEEADGGGGEADGGELQPVAPPTATQPAPPPTPGASCSGLQGACNANQDCCGELVCTEDGKCRATCQTLNSDDCSITGTTCCRGLTCKFTGAVFECRLP